MKVFLMILAGLALLAWLGLRRRAAARQQQPARPAARKRIENTAYHAVSIKFSKDACAAAKGLTGRRFLANEAPRLPLPDCDAGQCQCHFTHHPDRRSGKDRRSPFGRGAIGGGTGRFDRERRGTPDRRRDADPDDF